MWALVLHSKVCVTNADTKTYQSKDPMNLNMLASHEKSKKKKYLLPALLSITILLLSLYQLMVSLAMKLMQCFVSWLKTDIP